MSSSSSSSSKRERAEEDGDVEGARAALAEATERFVAAATYRQAQLAERARQLDEREAHLALMTARAEASPSSEEALVTLSVRGARFQARLAALRDNYPDSYFGRRFSGRWEPSMAAAAAADVFIDRPSAHFPTILNYVCGDPVQHIPEADRAAVAAEADYYGLADLVMMLNEDNWYLESLSPKATETAGCLTVHSTGQAAGYIGSIQWKTTSSGPRRHTWTLHVDHFDKLNPSGYVVRVGIIDGARTPSKKAGTNSIYMDYGEGLVYNVRNEIVNKTDPAGKPIRMVLDLDKNTFTINDEFVIPCIAVQCWSPWVFVRNAQVTVAPGRLR